MSKTRFLKGIALTLALTVSMGTALVGCGSGDATKDANTETSQTPSAANTATTDASPAEQKAKPVTLKMSIFSDQQFEYYEKHNLVDEYKKVAPNVTIELEKLKVDDYEKTLKIRRSANEMPDVVPLKPGTMANFKEILLPLNDLQAAKDNKFAENFAFDGNILGLPQFTFNEFVWYRKSIFDEYKLTVPKTWKQFIETAKTIKAGGKYTPLILPAKDAWTNYPYNGFIPSLIANDGTLPDKMATQDDPFSKDKPFYKAYTMIQELNDAKVYGKAPLGLGFYQAKAMFVAKQGAMIAMGAWLKGDIKAAMNNDFSDIGMFLMPIRENESDKLNTAAVVDMFFAVPKDGKNTEEAKKFVNWISGGQWYQDYINDQAVSSTVNGISSNEDDFFKPAFEGVDVNLVVLNDGGTDFLKIRDAVKFDTSTLGQSILSGQDMDKLLADLNKKWKEARTSLGLK